MAARKNEDAVRVAVVDDHALVRASLVYLFEPFPDISVVAEGANGRDAMELVRRGGFDVLVMDLEMPGQSGVDVIASLRSRAPGTPILVLSAHPEEKFATTLLRRGARSYLSKGCEPAEIIEAIRTLAAGRPYIPSRIAELVADELEGHGPAPAHLRLSARELQVLLRLARGQATRQVASELYLSTKTISACRVRVMEKLGLQSTSDMTHYALKHGLVD